MRSLHEKLSQVFVSPPAGTGQRLHRGLGVVAQASVNHQVSSTSELDRSPAASIATLNGEETEIAENNTADIDLGICGSIETSFFR